MKKTILLITGIIASLHCCGVPAIANDLSGWAFISKNIAKTYENDVKTSETDSLNQNYFLRLNRAVTPAVSYELTLRTNLLDRTETGVSGLSTTNYQRKLEPAIDLSLRNHIYDVHAGYRRLENWESAHLSNATRDTQVLYYTRFNLAPRELPSLLIQYNREESFDYLPQPKRDDTSDQYTVSSSYVLPTKNLDARYNITYLHDVDKSAIGLTSKSVSDTFTTNYALGYAGTGWNRKARYTATYLGNYSRNKLRKYLTQAGVILFQRTALGGLFANIPPVQALAPAPLLINGSFTDNTGIMLNTPSQHIGIWISFDTVDRLYVYYSNNGVANPVTWQVYTSNDNFNWALLTTRSVTPVLDSDTGFYRYEILFPAASANYFKVVNTNTVPMVNGSNVEVTEIEAYNAELVTGSFSNDITSFSHGMNFTASVQPVEKINLSFNYSMDRRDQNPESIFDSISGAFGNIFTNSISGDNSDFRSSISRNYGMTATWYTHTLFTTSLRLQRNENFDNKNDTDFENNTYNLSFHYVPLPTLDTNLSFVRNDRFSFNTKESTHDAVLVTVGAELYDNVHMITDASYSESRIFTTNTESKTYMLNGTLDALIRDDLSGTLTFNLSRTDSASTATTSKEVLTILNYRPGRFVNLTGNFRVSDLSGDVTITETFIADWLPFPAIRLNVNYEHSDADIDPLVSDSVNGYVIWYIQNFADLRFSSSYTRQTGTIKRESYDFNTNLNCRF
jgi:hypothetical protein